METKDKRAIALWRISVLGPLISARLEHGDIKAHLDTIASRTHEAPDGRIVTLSTSTLEAWLYAYRREGFDALCPEPRSDRGASRKVPPALRELIVRAKRERPRRSIRRLIAILERAGKVQKGVLTRSTVHRLLLTEGISGRPPREGAPGDTVERRSFTVEHVGDLWMGDAMHGPMVIAPDGTLKKAYLLTQLDCASRFVPHSYFALSEGSAAQEHGFKQAILKHGLPRSYFVDRGPAYTATSLRLICAELGVRLVHTRARDCEAKGAIERWHRRWRDEVGDELPARPLPLAELNALHWAWLAADYHRAIHDTTQRAPREHFLAEVAELRPVPHGKNLDEVFLHRETREVRKDGTVRWGGGFLEVRTELVGKKVELRFDPTDEAARPRVFLSDRFVCDTVPLDRLANGARKRHRAGAVDRHIEPSGLDPFADLCRDHYDRVRLGADANDDTDGDDVSPSKE
jgi:transposase InsO family protein